MSDEEVVRYVTGRWNDKLLDYMEERDRIVFVPSPHTGPHSGPLLSENILWMMFSCRLPEGVPESASQLSRAELLVWLTALADDTRLQILAMLKERDELCAQDIITMLETSQSTASRHLRQLSASGYILEHRTEAGKCYRLNDERFEDTIKALHTFIG
jgi:DNA-binding transcriptional ArsR family regulator